MNNIEISLTDIKKLILQKKIAFCITFLSSILLAFTVSVNLPIFFKGQVRFTAITESTLKFPGIAKPQKILTEASPAKAYYTLAENLPPDLKSHIKKIEILTNRELTEDVISLLILTDSKDSINDALSSIGTKYLNIVNYNIQDKINLNREHLRELKKIRPSYSAYDLPILLRIYDLEDDIRFLSKIQSRTLNEKYEPIAYRQPNQFITFLVIFITTFLTLTTTMLFLRKK